MQSSWSLKPVLAVPRSAHFADADLLERRRWAQQLFRAGHRLRYPQARALTYMPCHVLQA